MKYFSLFSNCIAVKGKNGCVILDLQRGEVLDIPKLFFKVYHMMQSKRLSIDELKGKYDFKYDDGIERFFSYLEEKGVGYRSNKPFEQENLDTSFAYAGMLKTIEFDFDSIRDHTLVYQVLSNYFKMGLREIIIKTKGISENLKVFLSKFDYSPIKSIQLVIKQKMTNESDLLSIVDNCCRISRIITPNKLTIENKRFYTRNQFSKISFIVHIHQYCESLHHNVYANNYIFLDNRNGLWADEKFTMPFKLDNRPKLWSISKSKVEGCKDCKFRNICVDSVGLLKKRGKYYRKESCELFPELF